MKQNLYLNIMSHSTLPHLKAHKVIKFIQYKAKEHSAKTLAGSL